MLSNPEILLTEAKITISFGIMTWNAKEFVTECLQSIRENCAVPAEIIVADNASRDGTPERLRERYPECGLGWKLGRTWGLLKGVTQGLRRPVANTCF